MKKSILSISWFNLRNKAKLSQVISTLHKLPRFLFDSTSVFCVVHDVMHEEYSDFPFHDAAVNGRLISYPWLKWESKFGLLTTVHKNFIFMSGKNKYSDNQFWFFGYLALIHGSRCIRTLKRIQLNLNPTVEVCMVGELERVSVRWLSVLRLWTILCSWDLAFWIVWVL